MGPPAPPPASRRRDRSPASTVVPSRPVSGLGKLGGAAFPREQVVQPGADLRSDLRGTARQHAGGDRLPVPGILVGPWPAGCLRPGLRDAPEQQIAVLVAGTADPLGPRFGVDLVRALLLQDLPSSLRQRLDRAVAGAGPPGREGSVAPRGGGRQ